MKKLRRDRKTCFIAKEHRFLLGFPKTACHRLILPLLELQQVVFVVHPHKICNEDVLWLQKPAYKSTHRIKNAGTVNTSFLYPQVLVPRVQSCCSALLMIKTMSLFF